MHEGTLQPDKPISSSERRLIHLEYTDIPADLPDLREPPDKRQARDQLRATIRALTLERTVRDLKRPKKEEWDFDGHDWTRGTDGKWHVADDDMEENELHEFNSAAISYFTTAKRDNITIHRVETQPSSNTTNEQRDPTQIGDQVDTGANINATNDARRLRNLVWIQPSSINTAKKDKPKNMLTTIAIGQAPMVGTCGKVLWVNTYLIPNLQNDIRSPTAINAQFSTEYSGFNQYGNVDDDVGEVVLHGRNNTPDLVFQTKCVNGLWWLYDPAIPSSGPNHPPKLSAHIAALSDSAKYELWHQCLGHCGKETMTQTSKCSDGMPTHLKGNAFYRCPSCMSAKMRKQPTHQHNPLGAAKTSDPEVEPPPPVPNIPQSADEELQALLDDVYLPDAKPGQHFHIDHGFVRGSDFKSTDEEGRTITSIDGKRSYCLIVDRATRYMWIHTSVSKDPPINAVRAVLQKFKSDDKHRTVRTDQDKSLGKSDAFRAMVQKEDFILELTGSDASKQNTRAERPHLDLGNMMRCMLHSSGLGSEYWSYAIQHAVYIKNRLWHSSLKCSPFQAMTGKRPNLAHLRTFGSIVYAKNPGKRKAKLDHNTSQGIFLGFSATAGNVYYRDEKTANIKIGTHVLFDEAHTTSAAGRAPLAAEALQRLGYHVRESWIDLELRTNLQADVHNAMIIEKLTPTATIPTRGTEGSIGYDLVSDKEKVIIEPGQIQLIPTGIAARAPPGSYLRIAPRSGLTVKRRLHTMAGVVDPDYTGNVMVVIHNFGHEKQEIKRGDKIAQLIVECAQTPKLQVVDKVPETSRGADGFGSTDLKAKASDPPPTPTAEPNVPAMAPPIAAAAAPLAIDPLVIRALHVELEMPYDIHLSDDPFDNRTHRTINVGGNHPTLGMELQQCTTRGLPKLLSCTQATPAARMPCWKSQLKNGYVTSVNDIPVRTIDDVQTHISKLRQAGEATVTIGFSTLYKHSIHPESGLPQLYMDQMNIIADHLWHISNGPEWQERALGSIPVVDDMIKSGKFPYDDDDIDSVISALKKKSLKHQRKLTRRILLKDPTWNEWRDSEWKQLDQYEAQDTFGPPIPPPKNVNILRLLWTYLIKDDGRKKARCVCNGSKKMRGSVTLAETYASSLDQTASRIFWAATAINNFITIGADAANAFAEAPPPVAPLYVYVDQPFREWYRAKYNKDIPLGYVMKVKKALQGHPESARLWALLIDRVIQELNLKPCTHEPNLYYTNDYNGTGKTVLFLRQVDDFAIACQDVATADRVIAEINNKMTIEVKKLGLIERYNGVDVLQTRHYVKLYNSTYIKKILANHEWLTPDKYPSSKYPLPMKSDATYQRRLESAPPLSPKDLRVLEEQLGFTYRQAIGELLFALVTCRPDISFPVIKLSQYSTRPAKEHFDAVMEIYAYLRDTAEDGLFYWRQEPRLDLPVGPIPTCRNDDNYSHSDVAECIQHYDATLVCAKDSDFASDSSHRKSVTGVVIKLAGGSVLFKTAFQPTTALSSTEAEFTAAATAGKYILYLRSILDEIGLPQESATILFEDNQGSLLMASAQKPTKRTRHMATKAFAIQEWIERDLIAVKRIATHDNYSDALTKALGRTLFYRHNDFIMGRVIPEFARPNISMLYQRNSIQHLCAAFEIQYLNRSDLNSLDPFCPIRVL